MLTKLFEKSVTRLGLSILAISFALFLLAISATAQADNTLKDVLGRPVRVAVWNVPNSFIEGIVALDLSGVIDTSFASDTLMDHDLVVVFVDGWDEILNIPLAKTLGFTEQRLRNLRMNVQNFDSVAISNIIRSTRPKDGRIFQLQAYNERNLSDLDIECQILLVFEAIADPDFNAIQLPEQHVSNC